MYGVHNYINNVSIRTMSIFISVDKTLVFFSTFVLLIQKFKPVRFLMAILHFVAVIDRIEYPLSFKV